MEFDTRTNTWHRLLSQVRPLSDTVLTEGADLREIPDYTGKSTALGDPALPGWGPTA